MSQSIISWDINILLNNSPFMKQEWKNWKTSSCDFVLQHVALKGTNFRPTPEDTTVFILFS